MTSFWNKKKVAITGAAGFAGSHAVDLLLEYGAAVTAVDISANDWPKNLAHVKDDIRFIPADLLTAEGAAKACGDQEVVLNLAARTGSIAYNAAHPGGVFRDNVLMSVNMMEAARQAGVERFLAVSSSCVYPPDASVPTPETEGFLRDPEPANFGYGWAKRMLEVQAKTYAEEFGLAIAIVRPYNGYGPRDHFDPAVSHVIAALIKRAVDGEDPVTVWGDGTQKRTFLHVRDFARGLILAAEKYPVCDPVNIGADEETTIADLAKQILALAGSKATLYFDTTKPGGQARRHSSTTKAKDKLGFTAEVPLAEGLAETIAWYRRNL